MVRSFGVLGVLEALGYKISVVIFTTLIGIV